MKNSEYWEKRIANNTWTVYNSLEEKNKALMEMYQEATLDIQNELYAIAQKINGGKSVTLSDMHKYNRLNSLQSNIEKRIEQLGEDIEKFGKENMQEGFKEVYSNARQELGETSFSIPNERLMEQMMNTPWEGSSFSKRLWENTGVLARNLNEILTIGLTQGKTITEMALQLSNRMNKGLNAAHKLIRTETVHYLNESAFKAYQDGGCEEVEVWAAKDERTCDICGKRHRMKYKIDKRPVLPFHPNCRCTYLPVINKEGKEKKEERNIDYMSNRFVPSFGETKEINLGNILMNLKSVKNSEFMMLTDINNTTKNKAIRLYEKKLRKIQETLPEGFDMPQIAVVDFNKWRFAEGAIAGYNKDNNMIFINSNYDTEKKISKYLTKNEGYFASTDTNAPLLHELGHKYHYDIVEVIANRRGISYNKAKEIFDNGISQYILSESVNAQSFICTELSKYAATRFDGIDRINEIMAEYFTARDNKSKVIQFINSYIKEVIQQ